MGNFHPLSPQCDCLVTFSIKAKAIFSNHAVRCVGWGHLNYRHETVTICGSVRIQRRQHAQQDESTLEADCLQKTDYIKACVVSHQVLSVVPLKGEHVNFKRRNNTMVVLQMKSWLCEHNIFLQLWAYLVWSRAIAYSLIWILLCYLYSVCWLFHNTSGWTDFYMWFSFSVKVQSGLGAKGRKQRATERVQFLTPGTVWRVERSCRQVIRKHGV